MNNAKRRMNKTNQVFSAWTIKAPEEIFSGMTLEQLKASIKPALDAQSKLEDLLMQVKVARKDYIQLSKDAYQSAFCAVQGVKGNKAYGMNSSLYAAMGYVITDDRKSGRTWKAKEVAAAKPVEG